MDKIFPTNFLSQSEYEKLRKRKAYVFWLVGNSGSGKTTIAKATESLLYKENFAVKCIDGDNIRSTINSDLDLSVESRKENIRRSAEVAKLFLENGTSVIGSFISPTENMRNYAKNIIGDRFKLIYIHATAEDVIKRDVKGLYKNNGDSMNKSLSMFETPSDPDLIIRTSNRSIEYSANILFNFILNQPV